MKAFLFLRTLPLLLIAGLIFVMYFILSTIIFFVNKLTGKLKPGSKEK